jgi:tetratricopeptide (TPR) repeat protein
MRSRPRFRLGDLAGLDRSCDFLSPEEVDALGKGELTRERLEEFNAHSADCPSCAELAADYDLFVELLEEERLAAGERRAFEESDTRVWNALVSDRRHADRRRRVWPVLAAAAAATVLIVVLLLPWRVTPPLVDELDSIPLIPPPATRSHQPLDLWQRALAAWESNDLDGVCRILEEGISTDPEQADLFFYLGYFRLRLEHNTEAVEALEAADRLQAEFPSENTRWYLAIAYDRVGRRHDACVLLRSVASMGGKRAGPAGAIAGESCQPD